MIQSNCLPPNCYELNCNLNREQRYLSTWIPAASGMAELDGKGSSQETLNSTKNDSKKEFDSSFLLQLPDNLRNWVKSQLTKLAKDDEETISMRKDEGTPTALNIGLEKQLETWRDNPSWNDQPAQIEVSVPQGSLCNLSVNFDVGLPPDAVFNIVSDPENRRVFKNIKEVISRKVILDEGHRQMVELEQAAIWKFLWWSGTLAVNVLVDQNSKDRTMKFKQLKTGFMKQFEGCWRIEPVFVDESLCHPSKPKTWEEYWQCTGGKGRVGSRVSLEQLLQPAVVPPPPISWYLRGITAKTTEMIANDLIAEAARIRRDFSPSTSSEIDNCPGRYDKQQSSKLLDIKERWAQHRRNGKKHSRRLLTA